MANGNGTTLSKQDQDSLKWISEHYLRSLYTLLDSNRVYLNQGITWSIGIISAVFIFGLTYISPLQDVRGPAGQRSAAAILDNITDADILLLTAVLAVAFAFVSNFMSRSIKGYLNLVRYATLYSRTVSLASGKIAQTPDNVRSLVNDIDTYDVAFRPPRKLGQTIFKMMTELGYGLFFGILTVLLAGAAVIWTMAQTTVCGAYFWLLVCSGPVWLVIELLFLRFVSRYFSYAPNAPRGWPEAEKLR
ncbi:MAG: hypothetical protein AB7P52_05070 [Alphaproteobacteria bacterium]